MAPTVDPDQGQYRIVCILGWQTLCSKMEKRKAFVSQLHIQYIYYYVSLFALITIFSYFYRFALITKALNRYGIDSFIYRNFLYFPHFHYNYAVDSSYFIYLRYYNFNFSNSTFLQHLFFTCKMFPPSYLFSFLQKKQVLCATISIIFMLLITGILIQVRGPIKEIQFYRYMFMSLCNIYLNTIRR